MSVNRSPAFLFYPANWRGSRRVQAMTFAERGMYLELLCEQWEAGAVPATPGACAERLGGRVKEWTSAWPKLKGCFKVDRRRDGGLINPKIDRLRREREQFIKAKRVEGLRAARKRWGTHGSPKGEPSTPNGSAMAKNAYRSRSTFGFDRQHAIPPTPPEGGATMAIARARDGDEPAKGFDAFWSAYPKQLKRAAAWKAWQTVSWGRRAPGHHHRGEWQCQQDSWIRERGRYVPMPATWLSEARWTDQPSTTPHISDHTAMLARATKGFLSS